MNAWKARSRSSRNTYRRRSAGGRRGSAPRSAGSQTFVDFIGEGRGSQALANALRETEGRVEALREELDALLRSQQKVFQTPPAEWIGERLSRVQEVVERRTEQSALLLRDVLGTIRLEPMKGDVGRPYYLAEP